MKNIYLLGGHHTVQNVKKWDCATVVHDAKTDRVTLPITSDPDVAWRVADMYEQDGTTHRWTKGADLPRPNMIADVDRPGN